MLFTVLSRLYSGRVEPMIIRIVVRIELLMRRGEVGETEHFLKSVTEYKYEIHLQYRLVSILPRLPPVKRKNSIQISIR